MDHHHTVETCIVVRRISISGIFLEEMDGVCYRPKKKRTIQTVTSNKSKSQGLSWYGVVSVPLAKVTYTSVMAPLMPKNTEKFWSNICCLQDYILFQGRPCIFQQDNAKPHSAHISNAWLRKKRVCTGLPAVLTCPLIENVWHILKRKRPRTVAHLKTSLQEEWDKVTPEILHHLVLSVPKHI